ncbi:hypothetical protein BV20DRAFT_963415 [Pilatotrama ljubarskyi]|nr:hypothetical protein BV20DRAFT_963415 [Pilatotrama ljubarskyi]
MSERRCRRCPARKSRWGLAIGWSATPGSTVLSRRPGHEPAATRSQNPEIWAKDTCCLVAILITPAYRLYAVHANGQRTARSDTSTDSSPTMCELKSSQRWNFSRANFLSCIAHNWDDNLSAFGPAAPVSRSTPLKPRVCASTKLAQ